MSLVLENLRLTLAGRALFAPLTLTVEPGCVATVMGPSGVGKSTLLDAIAGHLAPAFSMTGRIALDGRDLALIPPEARRIGLVFQDAVLFPHLSVGDNLAFGLASSVKGRDARRGAVERALAQAGLAGLYGRDPASLSGGQRSRAALMRTLLAAPAALLLDEPFSKLDTGLRDEIRAFTFANVRERAVPALMVTHDPADAEAAAGQTIGLTSIGETP